VWVTFLGFWSAAYPRAAAIFRSVVALAAAWTACTAALLPSAGTEGNNPTQILHFATFPAPCSPAPGYLLPALCSYVELLPNDCCEMIYIGIGIRFVSTAAVVDAMQIQRRRF
jgi:hypothetical protein